MSPDPFEVATDQPLVALRGERCGYVQIAPAPRITMYRDVPDEMLFAARDWAARLEALGARRVYWITLSEVVRRLHIHLYPRWSDEESKGLELFEKRNAAPQPAWTPETVAALHAWQAAFRVHLL